jgi:hypothetical protein
MSRQTVDRKFESVLKIWWYARELTYNFLDWLPQKKLIEKLPRPALDEIGKHFLEMGDVTIAYAEGLKTGTIAFEKVRWKFPSSEVGSKTALIKHLKKSDRTLQGALKMARKSPSKTYNLAGERLSLVEVIIWLALHEILHHGQLVSYGYLLKTGFPDSWVDQWALPTEEEQ